MVDEAVIGGKFRALAGELNERRRLWAASEARAAGISVETIRKGIVELGAGERLELGRVRKPGGGRKPLTEVASRAPNAAGSHGGRPPGFSVPFFRRE